MNQPDPSQGDLIAIDNVFLGGRDRPLVENDQGSTTGDLPRMVNVLANGIDLQGDAIEIASFTQPSNEIVTRGDGGHLVYSPSAHYFGSDTFDYLIRDSNGNQAQASVHILVDTIGSEQLILNYDVEDGNGRSVAGSSSLGADHSAVLMGDTTHGQHQR